MQVGFFNNKDKEFVITNMYPKRPLLNYLWNNETVLETDHLGKGWSLFCTDDIRRKIVDGERHIFIESNNEIYSANRNYSRLPFEAFQCHVGQGYQKIVSSYNGLRVEKTITVPKSGYAERVDITITNTAGVDKQFNIYFYTEPMVNVTEHLAYGHADWCNVINGLLFEHDAFNSPHSYTKVGVIPDTAPMGYEVSRSRFLGYGTLVKPDGIPNISSKGTTFEMQYCAALKYHITLGAGESWQGGYTVVCGKSVDEIAAYKYTPFDVPSYYNRYVLSCGDNDLDTLANIWLKRQVDLGKTWGRIYGKGFRDVIQDIAGFVSLDHEYARGQIIRTLKYQFYDGNSIRQFNPIYNHPYRDGAAWIPSTVLGYIKETGDLSILQEKVGYFDSEVEESVLQHMQRGVDFLTDNLSENGLALWGGGDWNDSINNAGAQGKGKSVWLSIATVKALNDYISILRLANGTGIEQLESKRNALISSIKKHGDGGGHFIYGINDEGERVGEWNSVEGKMFLNPQTWAVLAEVVDHKEGERLMDKVENYLSCPFGYLLHKPAYATPNFGIGRVTYFGQGLYENGSVYNHGVAFKIAADCKLGRGDIAYQTLRKMLYNNPDNTDSGVEPYALSNMYIGIENPFRAGDAPLSWITGTAGWVYRCITEYICGIKPEYEGLRIEPCLPREMNEVSILREFRGKKCNILLKRSNINRITVNGQDIEGEVVPLEMLTEETQIIKQFK